MRFMIKVSMPVEAGNEVAKKGKLGEIIASIVAEPKPEAAYFTEINGQRTGLIFLEMSDASQIPMIAEPWFLSLNASVEIRSVMTPDDLKKAGTHI
jgi:hypothetical protein